MTTANPEADFAKTVSLGCDQLQRLALAAESLAEDEADVDPEFAARLRADARRLDEVAAAGTVRVDDGLDASASMGVVALDD